MVWSRMGVQSNTPTEAARVGAGHTSRAAWDAVKATQSVVLPSRTIVSTGCAIPERVCGRW
jgi:hypothetical protein